LRTRADAPLLSTHDLDLALRSADRIWLPAGGVLGQSGAPEDLVLSNAFEAAFHRAGVRFDKTSGAFSVNGQRAGRVALMGEGVELIWTRRALERAGFVVADDGDFAQIVVSNVNGSTAWDVQKAGENTMHASIHALLAYLRNREVSLP
jgi:iron complex transport system ATP-binding protein